VTLEEWCAAHPRIVVAGVMLLSSLLVYVPYLSDLDKIARYWDGPPYMYVAKTLYRVPADHPFVPMTCRRGISRTTCPVIRC
jgi:hypothetical protein